MNQTNNRCCENYNGTLDITNSCIFCKTFIGNTNNRIREEFEKKFELDTFGEPNLYKDITDFFLSKLDSLLKQQREELVEKIEKEIPTAMVIKPYEIPPEMFDIVEKNTKLVIREIKDRVLSLIKQSK